MLDAILAEPSDKEKIAQGSLPGGCLLHLETALTYARMAHKERSNSKTEEFIGVVIEHLEEIKEKASAASGSDQSNSAASLSPVRWKCGAVYIDQTPYGFCVVSERGAVWNMLGGWSAATQPSSRNGDWYREHNLSNLQAALQAARAANDFEARKIRKAAK